MVISEDRVAMLLAVGIALMALVGLCAIFVKAVARDLSVEVVDRDGSKVSAGFVDAIRSTRGIKVTMRSSSLDDIENAIRSGNLIAAVYIPENLERDVMRGRRPHVNVLFNKQFFSSGHITSKSILAALSAATADLEAGPHSRAFTLGPVVVEQYVASIP